MQQTHNKGSSIGPSMSNTQGFSSSNSVNTAKMAKIAAAGNTVAMQIEMMSLINL